MASVSTMTGFCAWLIHPSWLLFLFSCMIFLTASFIYATIDIERHKQDRRTFLVISWSIFIIPSLLAAVLVFTPFPAAWVRLRHAIGEQRPGECSAFDYLNMLMQDSFYSCSNHQYLWCFGLLGCCGSLPLCDGFQRLWHCQMENGATLWKVCQCSSNVESEVMCTSCA